MLGRIIFDAKCRIINQYFPIDSLYGPAVLNNLIGDPALRIKYTGALKIKASDPCTCQEPRFLRTHDRRIEIPAGFAVKIYNALGQCVHASPPQGNKKNIRLAGGIYFMCLENSKVNIIRKVVVLE